MNPLYLNLLTLALASLLASVGAYGLWLARRASSRVAGGLLALEAAAALVVLWLLCTLPFGIGQTLIRVAPGPLLAQAAGTLVAVLGVAGLVALLARRLGAAQAPARHWGQALIGLAVLAVSGGAMFGLTRLSLPERERERDPLRRQLTLPEGFTQSVYASGRMDNPTVITFGPAGELYIGDIGGTLWVARDGDGDGVAERITPWAEGFNLLVGLAWRDGELYAASSGKVEALRDRNGDDRADERRTVVDGLPSMILMPHSNNQIVFGPDGRLYFGVGSTTRAERDPYELAASVLSVNSDGSDLQVFARGFGNTFGVAFNAAGELFGGDNSPGAGDELPDELNHIMKDEHYGYPYVYGDPEQTMGTQGALVSFPAHSAPTGMAFYAGGAYPAEYADNAFVTLWGRGELARVELAQTPGGSYLSRVTTFASGLLYPVGVTTGPDGNLYVVDFGTSAVYRIAYDGAE